MLPKMPTSEQTKISMDHPQKRSPASVYFFVASRTTGEEVRFPRPPETTKVPRPKVTKPTTKKHAFPWGKLLTWPNFCRFILIGFLLWCWCGPHTISFLLAKFGPQPGSLILPPPPYYEGETIKGLSTAGQYHTWIYVEKAGWVDP